MRVSSCGFWRRAFSDGGEPSFSRAASGVLVAFSCGWLTYLVHCNHTLPDGAALAGLAAVIGAPYALNQGRAAIETICNRAKE